MSQTDGGKCHYWPRSNGRRSERSSVGFVMMLGALSSFPCSKGYIHHPFPRFEAGENPPLPDVSDPLQGQALRGGGGAAALLPGPLGRSSQLPLAAQPQPLEGEMGQGDGCPFDEPEEKPHLLFFPKKPEGKLKGKTERGTERGNRKGKPRGWQCFGESPICLCKGNKNACTNA